MASPLYTKQLMDKYGVSWFKFDEASGSAFDSKGSFVGTFNGATRAVGWNGQGYSIKATGINQYVLFNSPIIPTSNFTIRFKIKCLPNTGQVYFLCTNNNDSSDGSSKGLKLFISTDGKIGSYYYDTAIRDNYTSSVVVADDKWHEIIYSRSNAKTQIYSDGNLILEHSNTISTLTHTNNLSLLNWNGLYATTGRNLIGELDELEVYNQVLTAQDFIAKKNLISSNEKTLSTQRNIDKNGVAKFSFDEASGNVLDSVGSNIGTVTGATRVTGYNGIGNALNFASGNNVVFSSKPIPLGKKSIRFKFKRNGLPSATESILNDSFVTSSTSTYGNLIAIDNTGKLFWILYYGARATARIINLATTINICDNQWHDILLTWDGTVNANGIKIYIDNMKTPNVTQTAVALETTVQSNNLVIGKTLDTGYPYPLTAQLDEVEIYNEVIDPLYDYTLKELSSISEKDFIYYGMGNGSVLDLLSPIEHKSYILQDEQKDINGLRIKQLEDKPLRIKLN